MHPPTCRLPTTGLERGGEELRICSKSGLALGVSGCFSDLEHLIVTDLWLEPAALLVHSTGHRGFSTFLISPLNSLCSASWGQDCHLAFFTWWFCFPTWVYNLLQGWSWLDHWTSFTFPGRLSCDVYIPKWWSMSVGVLPKRTCTSRQSGLLTLNHFWNKKSNKQNSQML